MMSKWKPLTGRITLLADAAFPVAHAASAHDVYRQVWGTPQGFQQAPNPLMPGNANGVFGGLGVLCTVAPNRIDFSIGPGPAPEPALPSSLRLVEDSGSFYNELRRIVGLLDQGQLTAMPLVNRVSAFAQFISVEADVPAANRVVMAAIPERYRVNLKDEEAFVLQLSTQERVRDAERLALNFVRKWSVEQFQIVTVGVVAGFPITNPSSAAPQIENYLSASIAIECNTRPVPEPLTRSEQAAALFEGLQLTSEGLREYRVDVEGFGGAKATH